VLAARLRKNAQKICREDWRWGSIGKINYVKDSRRSLRQKPDIALEKRGVLRQTEMKGREKNRSPV
jgi:hypothetical protein